MIAIRQRLKSTTNCGKGCLVTVFVNINKALMTTALTISTSCTLQLTAVKNSMTQPQSQLLKLQ